MSTTKKRLNITLSPATENFIVKIAKRDKVPQATKIAELLDRALILEEDTAFDALVMERDKKGARFISHSVAWK